jgi:hypothetical protein
MTPEDLARKFHDTYERLAPSFGYETREDTRDFDPNTKNGKLMVATCAAIIADREVREVAGRTIDQWREFARRDDCLDQMVPSDLRAIVNAL